MLYHLISALFAVGKSITKEKEEPIPANAHFDYDAYNKDIKNGMSHEAMVRKRQARAYWTTEPENLIVDRERYEHHCKVFGKETADGWVKNGFYKIKMDRSQWGG